MQACLENASLPLFESVPTWTIRVARPLAPNRNELAQELRGVPKAALRQVFGKVLGTRVWQQHRTEPTGAMAASGTTIPVPSEVPDSEISTGMLRYLCAEAATALRENRRVARSVALTVLYSNGESESVREPLPAAVNDPLALEAAAHVALRRLPSANFVSLKLDLTATSVQA
jgi:hypothetical protein